MKNIIKVIGIVIILQLSIISGYTNETDDHSDFSFGCVEPVANEYAISTPYEVKHFGDLYDSDRERSIPASVYYPLEGGCYPLIIVSHGGGGDRTSLLSHVEQLVVHEYVVIVPEHVGSNKSVVIDFMEKQGITFLEAIIVIASNTTEWENRPKDVSFLIDMAFSWNESDVDLFGKIDLNNIGCMGHSYGAYTTSAIMGARVNLPSGLTNLGDSRVDAGIALSPQGPGGNKNIDFVNNWFVEESWDNITRPISHHDEDDLLNTWRKIPFESMPFGNKYFLRFKNSKHIDFADSNIYELLNDTIGRLRNDETINVSKELTVQFFNIYLKAMDNENYTREYANYLCQTNEIVTEIFWDQKQGPTLSIVSPLPGYLYLFDTSLFPLIMDNTIVIGDITIQVTVEGFDYVEKVEFYLDDTLKKSDYEEPFEWVWDEWSIGRRSIRVVASDLKDTIAIDELIVLKIF
ncbi:MAG: Ig-like domain-containing protein [Candidatus Thermoplasmatota archaeon]|nr:Ig-like domain-containing protein [Candidatus Thermoplasmatota archaeon]